MEISIEARTAVLNGITANIQCTAELDLLVVNALSRCIVKLSDDEFQDMIVDITDETVKHRAAGHRRSPIAVLLSRMGLGNVTDIHEDEPIPYIPTDNDEPFEGGFPDA